LGLAEKAPSQRLILDLKPTHTRRARPSRVDHRR